MAEVAPPVYRGDALFEAIFNPVFNLLDLISSIPFIGYPMMRIKVSEVAFYGVQTLGSLWRSVPINRHTWVLIGPHREQVLLTERRLRVTAHGAQDHLAALQAWFSGINKRTAASVSYKVEPKVKVTLPNTRYEDLIFLVMGRFGATRYGGVDDIDYGLRIRYELGEYDQVTLMAPGGLRVTVARLPGRSMIVHVPSDEHAARLADLKDVEVRIGWW